MADYKKYLDQAGAKHLVGEVKKRFQKTLKSGAGIKIEAGTGADEGKDVISTVMTAYTISTKTEASGNEKFESDGEVIVLEGTDVLQKEDGTVIDLTQLAEGTNIYVKELEWPDRWFSGRTGTEGNYRYQFTKLEQEKIDLSDYQKIVDNTLQTTDKTVPGAINEVNTKITNHVDDTDMHVTTADKEEWSGKQDKLDANSEIEIKKAVIHEEIRLKTDGGWVPLTGDGVEGLITDVGTLKTTVEGKQDKLTSANAGDNITISEVGGVVKINATVPEVDYPVTDVLVDNETVVDDDGVAHIDLSGKADVSDLNDHIGDSVKHITAAERTAWNAKQGALTDDQLAAVNSGITGEKVTAYDGHLDDDDIHVSLEDKATWNNKQDKLTQGTGIKIENNVISCTVDTDGLATETYVNNAVAAEATLREQGDTTLDGKITAEEERAEAAEGALSGRLDDLEDLNPVMSAIAEANPDATVGGNALKVTSKAGVDNYYTPATLSNDEIDAMFND